MQRPTLDLEARVCEPGRRYDLLPLEGTMPTAKRRIVGRRVERLGLAIGMVVTLAIGLVSLTWSDSAAQPVHSCDSLDGSYCCACDNIQHFCTPVYQNAYTSCTSEFCSSNRCQPAA